MGGMNENITKKKRTILEIINGASRPISGKEIADLMNQMGLSASERTVRLYLQEMEEEGFLLHEPRKGRRITLEGRRELEAEKVFSRVGLLASRINQLTYEMDFDLNLRRGTVIVNVSLVDPAVLLEHLPQILRVFEKGYAMGTQVGLLYPGEQLGDLVIPRGRVGLCTVCSITLNGVLLKHGIPIDSLFSGLLELKRGEAKRFTELIYYNGTSIDPLALFIQSGMTDYLGAIADGNGHIGAGFREVPGGSYDVVVQLADKLNRIGLGAFLTIGKPESPLLNIPVHDGTCGLIVIGGLNPTAIFEESGVRLESRALGGLLEFNRLFPYTELEKQLLDDK